MSAKTLDYDKFFNTTPKSGEIVKTTTKTTPPELDGLQSVLKNFNQTLGLVNTTLSTVGIDPAILKAKLKEKIGMAQQRQQVQEQPYVETFRSPPPQIEKTKVEEPKQETMKIDIDKITNMIDLVLKFTKREDMTVTELKEFLTENKALIEGLF